ncbi:MAG: TetR/AcrR family transcriptional regulator [Thermomicrobiales bacterium]
MTHAGEDPEPEQGNTQAGRPGRPRVPETDRRILDAALRLLARDGYARMSVDAVAASAGVTKPTIYRRYRSKAELAEAALAALAAERDASAPDQTGDLRADLVAQLRHFRAGVSRPYGVALVGTVLAEEHETPELLTRYREQIVAPRRRMIRAVLDAAAERGELRPGADLDLAVNALVGAFYAQALAGDPFPADWEERSVATILAGLER